MIPALEKLHGALEAKAKEFWHVIKIGRTHLMDATPVRLGQEFSGYAQQVAYAKARAEKAIEALREVALGGTAVGTGLNRHIDFPKKALHHIKQRTGIEFYEAKNHFEAQGGKDAVVEASGHLKTIAVALFKIANDIRWLSSGPRCGIGEIQLPATQPGSSDHAGKGKPGNGRIAHDGVRTSDRQRRNNQLGRRERKLRAQCDDASDGARHPGIHPITGERGGYLHREMRTRHRGERRALPRTGGAFDGHGNQPLAKNRLRSRGRNCQGERQDRTNGSRDCTRKKDLVRRRTRARTGSDQNDRAGRNRRGVIASVVAKLEGPQFSGGANIAIKCPSHTYEQTVAFYRDTLGLPLIEEEKDGCIFQFGPNRLWIDSVPNLSHPDVWLELETNDTEAAESFLKVHGVSRRDEVEQLREDFNGFFISAPNGVIHLVVGPEEV